MTITVLIAARVADQRQPDPGIAGGALDDRAAGPQQPLLLGVEDDRQRRPVLDRAARIQELALAQDLAAGGVGHLVQAHQRRVADQIDEALANVHAAPCDRWPGTPVPRAAGSEAASHGVWMPATDQAGVLAFLEGGGLGAPCRADRHPCRDRPAHARARLQAQAPGPLQLPRLHHARATRAGAASRARAQPGNAPQLYRRVLAVTAEPSGLALDGAGEPVEWLLEMCRFPAQAQLDRIASRRPGFPTS